MRPAAAPPRPKPRSEPYEPEPAIAAAPLLASSSSQPVTAPRHDSEPPSIEVAPTTDADLAALRSVDDAPAPAIETAVASGADLIEALRAELGAASGDPRLADATSLIPVATTEPPRSEAHPEVPSFDAESAALRRALRLPRRALALSLVAAGLALGGGWLAQAVGRAPAVRPSMASQGPAAPERRQAAPAPLPITAAEAAPRAEPRPEAAADGSAPAANTAGAGLSAAMKSALERGGLDDPTATTVTVSSKPAGALLYRDEQPIGRGPINLTIRRGERAKVLALLDRHLPTRLTVDGSRTEVVIALTPIPERPMRASPARKAGDTPRAPSATEGPSSPDTAPEPPRAAFPPLPPQQDRITPENPEQASLGSTE